MDQFKNPMEIFKLLDKSNCRKCNKPTCLAFAAAVFQGQKRLDECPQLDREIIKRHGGMAVNQIPLTCFASAAESAASDLLLEAGR
jgi:CO dehydrogenase/acetyl-CoA synthase gamma subunit (corrinoid Fe-S protein)